MLRHAREERLIDWTVDDARLAPTADFVARVIRERYPTLDVPFHARWRHFVFSGRDLWREIESTHSWPDTAARARAAFDLAITSVLLDAGAGPGWRYRDALTGIEAARSEGLALASLRWFAAGGMSEAADDALRADAHSLKKLDASALHAAFQVDATNPLAGAEGRAQLLNRLGAAAESRPDLFATADVPRPGGLFDALVARAVNRSLPASMILDVLLDALGPIWRNRPALEGVSLGDCWPHPQGGFVPLHKLSQWLAYSLIEPLQAAGIAVHDIDGLTGLAEYRNGGLFLDMGALVPRDADAMTATHQVSDPFVVGWRSLTVALLDELAPLVRSRLGVSDEAFPLAKLLEGGTWAAGRVIARERRADGGPPLRIVSDGTVF
ncbi:hypothetical protein HNQ60_001841 [Povalibacter uvarum]|uniref:DUF1688 domain-containing protein n=2 Tax=Povalibacter uvarum TaxID=732238 RepID=A0A841HJR2_9GAMM|nr:hypothetical protein [Povalibacter uvarum]